MVTAYWRKAFCMCACEICIKPFFSVHKFKMHIKAHAGKIFTNAKIEEIVTNISPNPQSWRYISFSTAERSPKCNSTQEKSPSENLFILESGNNIKTHLKTFLLLHHCSPSRVFLIETGATINTSLGRLMVSPHGGDDMLAQVWSWSKYLSTNFTYKISFVNHLYLLNWELHNVPIYVPYSKSSTTQHPNLPLSFLPTGRSFLCPPMLSDVANVDLVDDQPSNSFSSI